MRPGRVTTRGMPDVVPGLGSCVRNGPGKMASTAGFEPATPGFIPLRLSPPPAGVRGLDCPFAMDRKVYRRCPSSLYTFLRRLRVPQAWLGIGMLPQAVKLSPTLSRSAAPFPCAAPNSVTRNPVLYPTELRGHHRASSLPRDRTTIKSQRRLSRRRRPVRTGARRAVGAASQKSRQLKLPAPIRRAEPSSSRRAGSLRR